MAQHDMNAPIDLGVPRTQEGAFDEHRPPSRDLISDCVHCGFCLTTCPTYVLWGEEMDTPRGRIHLMKSGLEGAPLTETMVGHFDACLGCMACVTSCPSGVEYDRLIEQTRAQVERRHTRSRAERALRAAIFSLFPYPARLRVARGPLRLAQRLGIEDRLKKSTVLQRISPQLAAMQRLTPRLGDREDLPERLPAQGDRRATVALLTGCVQREFFPGVNAATARVLAAEGCEVIVPAGQGCCGALSGHSGRQAEAQDFARRTIAAFEQAEVDYVVVNSAGCGSAMKEYDFLLDGDAETPDGLAPERVAAFTAKVRDLSEVLVELGPRATYHPLEVAVAYHDACHLGHAQGVREEPRELLRGIPGLTLKEIPEAALCCGSAGVYNILNPEPAAELGDRKAANVRATGAELLVTANPGCLMQITQAMERAGHPMAMAHTAVVLDAAQRGLPLSDLIGSTR